MNIGTILALFAISVRRLLHPNGSFITKESKSVVHVLICISQSIVVNVKKYCVRGGVACGGSFFHRDCFACESCNTSIASQAFQQKDGKRYCTPCYKQLYAKRCSGCSDYIVNGEFYTVDNDNWHKDCFRCEECREILQQQSFVQGDGKVSLVCETCLEKR